MQTMADVMNMPIRIAASDQTCALGAAMFASVAAGIYPDVFGAMNAMGSGFDQEYQPIPQNARLYEDYYKDYCALSAHMEPYIMNHTIRHE